MVVPKKSTIQEMQKMAHKKEGSCLSNEYVNSASKLKWQCKKGHVWLATPNTIQQGSWCSSCSGKAKHTIAEMKIFAEERGGKCLSKEYIDNKTKLKFRCAEGHVWEVKANHALRGVWCPICRNNISEELTRAYFESIFHKKFVKVKPIWLLNSRDNKMELDGYCEELGLAFEYQGQQHYFPVHFYHQSTSFEQRVDDDELKEALCKRKGITLIKIPYDITYEKIYSFIITELKKHQVEIPRHREEKYFHLKAFRHSHASMMLEKLMEIVADKSGQCLSIKYFGNKNKLKWKCAKGHIWEAKPNDIVSGRWCPECAGTKKLTIEEMQKLAIAHKGKCLSESYINDVTKLKWQCLEGHIWEATPHNVKDRNSWCPKCSGNVKLKIEDMIAIAKQHGGQCLSQKYSGLNTKLNWQCSEGHIWEAIANNVKNKKSWCPVCFNLRRNKNKLPINYSALT